MKRAQFVLVGAVLVAWAVYIVAGPIDWDLGWQMWLARHILDGDRLYVDVGITEQHPPLITWICAATTFVARIIRLDPVRFYLAVVNISVVICAAVATRIARADALVFAGLGAAALAVHGLAGGSGEQISTAFALPYLAAAANAFNGREQTPRAAWITGLVAGFGLALKPHYALVWLLAEIAIASKQRSWRSVLRPASIAAFSVWVAYIIATVVFTPEYFHAAMQAAQFYGSFMPLPLIEVVRRSPVKWLLLAWGVYIVVRRRTPHAALALMVLLAGTAMWIGGVVQMKGWLHHWTPALGLTIAAIALVWTARVRWVGIVIILALGTQQLVSASRYMQHAQEGPPTFLPAMTKTVNRYAPRGPILTLAHGLAIGFPMVNLTHSEWTLPESSLWMASGLYADEWKTMGPYHYRGPDQWIPFERETHDLIWRGIQDRPPRMIIQSNAKTDWEFSFHKFAMTDPRFSRWLEDWIVVDIVGPYEILVPRSSGFPPSRP